MTITLSDDLADLVAREARRRGSSVSEVIRGFIAQGLSEPSEPRDIIPWAALFHDPEMVPAERMEEAPASGWLDNIGLDRE
ncbi:MAG TPA: CopG family transcriptional regulator [Thermoanaerobaculia bacterium]|nr:CopG family transcriptional regulator [Thermoanaerobaculia bacterium]